MPVKSERGTGGPAPSCADCIKKWFKQNGWPQSVTEGWARAAGSDVGPWASQISILMAGRLEPKPFFFVALAQFNEAVATRNLACITDRRLLDRLKNGEPLCHDNGKPFDAADFFRLYVGQLEPPKALTAMTDEDGAQISAICMEWFEQHMRAQMLTRLEAWQALQPFLADWSPAQIDCFQVVLLGERSFTGAELTALHQKLGGMPPVDVMNKFTGFKGEHALSLG